MNVRYDLEQKLKKIRCGTPGQADEKILSDAVSQFERASKIRLGRSRRITIAAAVVAVIILIALAVILLKHQEKTQRQQPKITERQTTAQQPAQDEKPQPPVTQPVPEKTRISKKAEPARKKPAAEDAQPKPERISSYAAAGDVDSLAAILKTGNLSDKILAVKYLSQMQDERADEVLDELAAQLDPNNPEDHFLAEELGIEDFGIPEVEEPEKAETKTVTAPNTPAEKKPPPKQYITGWLTDTDGYTLQGTIQVGKQQAGTDAEGAFSLEPPDFAQFDSYIGYAVSPDTNLAALFRWYIDDDLNNIEIICTPFASASGSVIDVNAQPVNDVQFKILPDVNDQSVYVRSDFKGPWQINMAADGSFEITSLPTGYPLVMTLSRDDSVTRIPLGEPEPGGHLTLGQITLEAVIEEDSIIPGG